MAATLKTTKDHQLKARLSRELWKGIGIGGMLAAGICGFAATMVVKDNFMSNDHALHLIQVAATRGYISGQCGGAWGADEHCKLTIRTGTPEGAVVVYKTAAYRQRNGVVEELILPAACTGYKKDANDNTFSSGCDPSHDP